MQLTTYISCRQTKSNAFTLLELLLVLAVLALLATLSAPSLRSFLLQQQLRTTTMQIERALNTARQYAVLHGDSVSLDAETWALIVNGRVVRQLPQLTSQLTITWRGSFGRPAPVFNAAGDAAVSGSYTVCAADSCQRVVLARSGRVRSE